MIKPDEAALMLAILNRDDDESTQAIARRLGFDVDGGRLHYILDKWDGRGWWEYGVSLRTGWLTPEGEAEMPVFLHTHGAQGMRLDEDAPPEMEGALQRAVDAAVAMVEDSLVSDKIIPPLVWHPETGVLVATPYEPVNFITIRSTMSKEAYADLRTGVMDIIGPVPDGDSIDVPDGAVIRVPESSVDAE